MAVLSSEDAIARVSELLHRHLPKGWGYHVKVRHQANVLSADEINAHDLAWLIWRPEDVGNSHRYYRLEMCGNTGNEFLIIYGNHDGGPASARPETAVRFDTWSAENVFNVLVSEFGTYPPNQYGLT